MPVDDRVPNGAGAEALVAMSAGLATMGAPDLDVVVTSDFVPAVRRISGEEAYDDDRNGGSVAARTVTTPGGDTVVVVNWDVLATLTPAEVERVLAHEAGHAAIASRDEDATEGVGALFPDEFWDFQTAYGAGVAIDEFRCEAAVYRAGYPVDKSRQDPGLREELYGLNIDLIKADFEYQKHLDVADLRLDVLKVVLLHVRYMGCVAARHVHHAPLDPTKLGPYGLANWNALVKPTWKDFAALYGPIPDALTPWPSPAAETVKEAVPLIRSLTRSFGYQPGRDASGQETFHVKISPQAFQVRLNRANAETDSLMVQD